MNIANITAKHRLLTAWTSIRNYFAANRVKFTLILFVFFALTAVSLAEPIVDPEAHAFQGVDVVPAASVNTVEAARQVIGEIISTVGSAFRAVVSNTGLRNVGETITYFLLILMFSWNMVKAMVEGSGINSIVSEMVPLMMSFGIVYALLNLGGIGHVVGFMDTVASAIAGGNMGSFEGALASSSAKTFKVVSDVFSMPSASSNLSLSSPLSWLPIGVMYLLQLVAKLITAFFIVLALGIYIANIVLAYGSIMLASALAFVMVPFLLASPLSWIFDGWLRFTLGAAMTKVVGAFFLSFTDKLVIGMTKLSEKVVVQPNADFSTMAVGNLILYCGLILMAVLSAYLMMQVPGLAAGLLSGSAGASGFKGMRPLTGGVGAALGATAARGAAQTATGAVGVARAATASFMQNKRGALPSVVADKTKQVSEKYGAVGGALYKRIGGQVIGKATPSTKPPAAPPPPSAKP